MSYQSPSDEALKDLLINARTVAVVGASSRPTRPSHGVMARLLDAGYRVYPVNPGETEVLGQKAYARLSDLPESIDIVDVFRRSELTPEVADEAVAAKAKALWLQLGVASEDAANRAQTGGLRVVMDRCIAIELSRLRIPKKTP